MSESYDLGSQKGWEDAAPSLSHKKVLNEQLKRWMQCMQREIFLGSLVLADLKRVNQG